MAGKKRPTRKDTARGRIDLPQPSVRQVAEWRRQWSALQRAFFEAQLLPPEPPRSRRVSARSVFQALRQIKACGGLLGAACADIEPKVGESSKLARALDDVRAARLSIQQIANDLEGLV